MKKKELVGNRRERAVVSLPKICGMGRGKGESSTIGLSRWSNQSWAIDREQTNLRIVDSMRKKNPEESILRSSFSSGGCRKEEKTSPQKDFKVIENTALRQAVIKKRLCWFEKKCIVTGIFASRRGSLCRKGRTQDTIKGADWVPP